MTNVRVGDQFCVAETGFRGEIVAILDAEGDEHDELDPGEVRSVVVEYEEEGRAMYALYKSIEGLVRRKFN